jgi:hypothetical protein
MTDQPHVRNLDFPAALVKDRYLLTTSIRSFAAFLIHEASQHDPDNQSDYVAFYFDRQQVFQISAMLFQLARLADDREVD